jgi:hypothetical protein
MSQLYGLWKDNKRQSATCIFIEKYSAIKNSCFLIIWNGFFALYDLIGSGQSSTEE